jgi:GT2 family glycosyltransferase
VTGPSFSVVVPTRHRASSLERCLESLAALDYPRERLEVVVVVDGTDDRSSTPVVESYRDRLPLVRVQGPRAGPAAARNAGAAHAGGRGLAFTDDDCVAHPSWVARLAAAVEVDPAAAVGGRTLNGATTNPCSVASQVVLEGTYAHYNPPGRAPAFFATNNLAVPADGFRRIGGFDERFPYAEDREFCVRWLARGGSTAWAGDAVVHHLRELDLRGLIGQHVGYGRGAYHLHRANRTAPRLMPALESGFYRHLAAGCAARHPEVGRARVGALVAVAQVANALGFAAELVRWRGRAPARRAPSPSDRARSGQPRRPDRYGRAP